MNTTKLQTNIAALKAFVQSKGWSIVSEKEIQSGYQFVISDGTTRNPVSLFTTGKILIQGKPGSLQNVLKTWWDGESLPLEQPTSQANSEPPSLETSLPAKPISTLAQHANTPRIGLDESGKGDYFGPLVIGAAFVNAQIEPQLVRLGVRDSKQLSDDRILAMADKIKALCPCFVVPIEPKRYNELYAKIQNLNRLLAWGHAWTLENMLEKVSCTLAIVDQFGDPSYVQQALRAKGRQITVEQRTHAEEDIAVAAASILARARFVQQLELLSSQLELALPKGSSNPTIVSTARKVIARYGKDKLAEIAKLHFKTTETVLHG